MLKMLKCKDVAHLASEYLDNNTHGTVTLKIRLHLMMCACCSRFVKHLRITTIVITKLAKPSDDVDAELILKRIKERETNL